VEQAPIDETPARFAAAADQHMAPRFEGDHRQRRAERAEVGDVFTIEPATPVLPAMAQPGATAARLLRLRAAFLPFDEHVQCVLALADQAIAHPPAEAAAVGHQVHGLEDGGLAGAVVAGDQVQAWRRRQFQRGEAAQVMKIETGDVHTRNRGEALAPGARGSAHQGMGGSIPKAVANVLSRATPGDRGLGRCGRRAWGMAGPARPLAPQGVFLETSIGSGRAPSRLKSLRQGAGQGVKNAGSPGQKKTRREAGFLVVFHVEHEFSAQVRGAAASPRGASGRC
jgi:hypothetical protein